MWLHQKNLRKAVEHYNSIPYIKEQVKNVLLYIWAADNNIFLILYKILKQKYFIIWSEDDSIKNHPKHNQGCS